MTLPTDRANSTDFSEIGFCVVIMKKVLKTLIIFLVIISVPFGMSANAYTHSLVPGNTKIIAATQDNVNGAYIYSEARNQVIALYLPINSSILSYERFSVYFGLKDFVTEYDINSTVYIDLSFIDRDGKEYTFSPETEPGNFYDDGRNMLAFTNKGKHPVDYCGLISFSPNSFLDDNGNRAKDADVVYLRILTESHQAEKQKLFIGNVYYQQNNRLFEAYNIYNIVCSEFGKYTAAEPLTTQAVQTSNRTTAEKMTKPKSTLKATASSQKASATSSADKTTATTKNNSDAQTGKSAGSTDISTDSAHSRDKNDNGIISSAVIISGITAVLGITFAIAVSASDNNQNTKEGKKDDK